MAKAVGIIGSLTGKIGNAVYRVRRGEQIASVYQPNVNNPKSKRQQFSRAKMKLAVNVLKPFLMPLELGWSLNHPSYEFQAGVGKAIPLNNGVITGGSPDALEVVPAELAKCLSDPIMAAPMVSGLSFSEASEVDFSVGLIPQYFDGTDVDHSQVGVVGIVYNADVNEVVVEQVIGSSSSCDVAVEVPARWSGNEVHVYAFVKQLPVAVNGISASALPWRFPARTSACVYVGNGTIS